MTRQRSLLGNATVLVASQIIVKALNITVSIALVRLLGATELGRYAYIQAFCFPFGAIADFGLATLATREISRDHGVQARTVAILQSLLLRLAAVSSAAMIGIALVLDHDALTRAGIVIVAASNLVSALTTPSLVLLNAREQMSRLSLHRVAASVTGSAALVVALLASGSVLALLAASALTNVAMLVLARVLAGTTRRTAAPGTGGRASMLRAALPFGALMIVFALYYRVDMVMLQWLRGPRDVGLYAAAYRFLDTVVVLAASLGGPFFPRLSSLAMADPARARRLLEDTWRPLLALALPLSVGAFVLADDLVIALFGRSFAEAASILRILIWSALPLFWVTIANHAVIAADGVRPLAAVYALGLGLNVAGNLALVPVLGPAGAAAASVACEWVNLVLVVRLVRRRFGLSLAMAGLWRYAAAIGAMALALWLLKDRGLPLEIVAGGLVYAGALLALGYLRTADMSSLRRLLAQ
ncbi:MAG TPA: flippase [Methylomirabilota bacterium]|jgi:O-antigen/teichoic acid export membrane protein|nr:flippase [Methylomirabilota bacterium]